MQAGCCATAGDAVGQTWQACFFPPTVATLAFVGVAGQHPAWALILQVCPRYIPPRRLVLPVEVLVGHGRRSVPELGSQKKIPELGSLKKAQHAAADRHAGAAWPAPAAPSSTAAAALLLLRLVAAAAPAAAAALVAAAAALVALIAAALVACRCDDTG